MQNAGSSDEEGDLDAILDDEIDRYNSERQEVLKKKGSKALSKKFGDGSGDDEEQVCIQYQAVICKLRIDLRKTRVYEELGTRLLV